MTPHRLSAALAAMLLLCIPLSAWAQDPPSISLEMTLMEDTNGMPGDECGVSETLEVGEGAVVEVCYEVTNTGDVALDFHDLEDTELGVILNSFNFTLVPDASAFLTMTVVASVDTTFNGTWTAYNEGPADEVQSMDSATLTVVPASIELSMTLAPDTNDTPGDECGDSDTLLVQAGTVVEVCYSVTNTGLTPLSLHDLEDSELGVILDDLAFELAPGTSAFLTQTYIASDNVTFEGTWTAFNEGPENVTQSSDQAFLEVYVVSIPTLGWWSKVLMVLLLLACSGVYLLGNKVRIRA